MPKFLEHGSRAKRQKKGLCSYRFASGKLCDKDAEKGSAKKNQLKMGFCAVHLKQVAQARERR